jgi:hypothetical protein
VEVFIADVEADAGGVEIVGVGLLEVALELWVGFIGWWARGDLNPGPPPCEGGVLSRLDDGPPVR